MGTRNISHITYLFYEKKELCSNKTDVYCYVLDIKYTFVRCLNKVIVIVGMVSGIKRQPELFLVFAILSHVITLFGPVITSTFLCEFRTLHLLKAKLTAVFHGRVTA